MFKSISPTCIRKIYYASSFNTYLPVLQITNLNVNDVFDIKTQPYYFKIKLFTLSSVSDLKTSFTIAY